MNEQPFLKTLVSYGAMVLIFIGLGLGSWGKFYSWSLITSNMVERHLMAYVWFKKGFIYCIICHEVLSDIPLFLL